MCMCVRGCMFRACACAHVHTHANTKIRAHTYTRTQTRKHECALSLSLSLSRARARSLSFSLSLSLSLSLAFSLSRTHTRAHTQTQVLAARDEKMLQMQEQTGTLTAALVQMLQVLSMFVRARVRACLVRSFTMQGCMRRRDCTRIHAFFLFMCPSFSFYVVFYVCMQPCMCMHTHTTCMNTVFPYV